MVPVTYEEAILADDIVRQRGRGLWVHNAQFGAARPHATFLQMGVRCLRELLCARTIGIGRRFPGGGCPLALRDELMRRVASLPEETLEDVQRYLHRVAGVPMYGEFERWTADGDGRHADPFYQWGELVGIDTMVLPSCGEYGTRSR